MAFIRGEICQHVQDGFRIFLLVAYTIRLFGDKLKLFCIAAVPQEHHRPCLILNLSEKSDEGTPSVNNTMDREVALVSIQFERTFTYILQSIWEAEPS